MSGSLRFRLFLIIVIPLTVLATIVGAWRLSVAQRTAAELFDRTLMFAALAVSRDVALLDGDAISLETQRLMDDAAGGPVRYHVYGPDGVLVTGYAVPPLPVQRLRPGDVPFAYFDGAYKKEPVRVLRLQDVATIAGLTGTFTITVWQDDSIRNNFAWEIALRSFVAIAVLITALALLVWFGVRYGLKPLTDLEDAISRRSSEDLSPIQRAVPIETRGIVGRLNTLFGKVNATLDAQSAFISDAAHQLRNPIAGLRALGESIQTAPNLDTAKERAGHLVAAASDAGDLANKLLALERARAEIGSGTLLSVDLVELTRQTIAAFEGQAKSKDVHIVLQAPSHPVMMIGDSVMLREALRNLIDNALVHGGTGLQSITIEIEQTANELRLTVSDDGKRVEINEVPKILARFGQAEPGPGSGLGLSISEAIAARHKGELRVLSPATGFSVQLAFGRQPA